MKRAGSHEPDGSSKRPRTEYENATDPFDPTLEKKVMDLYEHGTDGTGYFSAMAFMTWPVKQKARLNVETIVGKKIHRFDIELSGKCAPYFDKLRFYSRDVFQIALKGARIEKTKSSSSPYSLAMTIKYPEGVIIKFITRSMKPTENGQVVDTWKLGEDAAKTREISQDDWFSTPPKPTSNPPVQTANPPIQTSNPPIQTSNPPIQTSNPPVQTTDITAIPHETLQNPIMSKKKAKRSRKERRAQEAAAAAAIAASVAAEQAARPLNSVAPSPQHSTPPRVVRLLDPPDTTDLIQHSNLSHVVTLIQQPGPASVTQSHTLTQAPITTQPPLTTQTALINQSPNTEHSEPRDSALDVNPAGFLNEDRDYYPPISKLEVGRLYNIIGVVTSVNPSCKTRRDEWSRTLTVVDPSICVASDGYANNGLRINCFTPKYEEWLPSPQDGDVVILRKIKTELYRDNLVGTGMSQRLRWTVLDPETGKERPRNMGSAPESEGLVDGFGYQCNPFWKPKEVELTHCLKLANWWREIRKIRQKDMGVVHQISRNINGARRQHRLIADASPNAPPNGFFDCTVEILHGHMNDNEVYSLYVTDYTANHEITPIQASWCPPELADRVLKIELWQAASELGPKMLRGEYYSIQNNRLKVSRGGFVEGTFTEANKLRKLNDSDSNPHLQALLLRRKDWENANRSSTGSSFKHRLIQDVDVDMFFNCTVEVLHAVHNERKPSCLYVTDYTCHPDLPSTWDNEFCSSGLGGRIVKISLWDSQIEMAKTIETGTFYSILHLRLKKTLTSNLLQGRLGGDERLVHKLNTVNTSNEELQALIGRKEEWKRTWANRAECGQQPHEKTIHPSEEPTKQTVSSALSPPYSTIKDVLASDKCPNTFSVVARVVDYYPLRLNECVVQQCTKCQEDIPAKYKACLACNDGEHEFIAYRYRFFFRLEDEEGEQIHVSVGDEQCSLLKGLEPANLHDDLEARQRFIDRIEPIIGNLVEVHEGYLRGIRIVPDTPMLRITIESWEISVSDRPTRAYGFVKHMMT